MTNLDITKYRDPEAAVNRREQMLADHGMYGAELENASTGLRDWMPVMPSIAEPTTRLQGGERFAADGRAWEVIHTPGHSPGHVCLWSAADRILLSGDHLLPAITSPVTFERGFERDPMSSYLDSLRRVAALAPALVLPGHGDPFPDGSRRAAAVERTKRRRLEQVWRIIEAEERPYRRPSPHRSASEVLAGEGWTYIGTDRTLRRIRVGPGPAETSEAAGLCQGRDEQQQCRCRRAGHPVGCVRRRPAQGRAACWAQSTRRSEGRSVEPK
jgi:glyoxylase-like metal-dependent hydrolase (beta-lactamase superfamily II)